MPRNFITFWGDKLNLTKILECAAFALSFQLFTEQVLKIGLRQHVEIETGFHERMHILHDGIPI
jgi:hypothetical protein